jgi:hypothetical protein
MNIQRFTKRQRDRFIKAHDDLNSRRLAWISFEERVRKVYNPILEELTLEKFHVIDFRLKSRKEIFPEENETNRNFIQLKMGMISIGLTEFEPNSKKLLFENGGILLFSQDPQGKVIVIFYPCKSEVYQIKEDHIVYGVYKHPSKLRSFKLERLFRFYLRFMYRTSILGKPSLIMRTRLMLIRFRVYFDVLKFGKALIPGMSAIIGTLSDSKGLASDEADKPTLQQTK